MKTRFPVESGNSWKLVKYKIEKRIIINLNK